MEIYWKIIAQTTKFSFIYNGVVGKANQSCVNTFKNSVFKQNKFPLPSE